MSCTRFLSATLDDVTKSFSCDCFSRVQSYHDGRSTGLLKGCQGIWMDGYRYRMVRMGIGIDGMLMCFKGGMKS